MNLFASEGFEFFDSQLTSFNPQFSHLLDESSLLYVVVFADDVEIDILSLKLLVELGFEKLKHLLHLLNKPALDGPIVSLRIHRISLTITLE